MNIGNSSTIDGDLHVNGDISANNAGDQSYVVASGLGSVNRLVSVIDSIVNGLTASSSSANGVLVGVEEVGIPTYIVRHVGLVEVDVGDAVSAGDKLYANTDGSVRNHPGMKANNQYVGIAMNDAAPKTPTTRVQFLFTPGEVF